MDGGKFILACIHNDIDSIKSLINNGYNLNRRLYVDNMPYSGRGLYATYPLSLAISYGNVDIVKCLVEAGADVNIDWGQPITQAVECGYVRLLKYLVEKGGNIRLYKDLIFYVAVSRGYFNIVKYLLKQCRYNLNEQVIYSIRKGYVRTTKYLVSAGADLSKCVITSLDIIKACLLGSIKYTRWLIKKARNIDYPFNSSIGDLILDQFAYLESLNINIAVPFTLHHCCDRDHLKGIKYLVSKGIYI